MAEGYTGKNRPRVGKFSRSFGNQRSLPHYCYGPGFDIPQFYGMRFYGLRVFGRHTADILSADSLVGLSVWRYIEARAHCNDYWYRPIV